MTNGDDDDDDDEDGGGCGGGGSGGDGLQYANPWRRNTHHNPICAMSTSFTVYWVLLSHFPIEWVTLGTSSDNCSQFVWVLMDKY